MHGWVCGYLEEQVGKWGVTVGNEDGGAGRGQVGCGQSGRIGGGG